VTVSSASLGIVAKVDLIEAEGSAVVPVDYKRGAAPDLARIPAGAWPADRVQVGAQALVLRDSGYACDHAELYYAGSKTRVRVELTEELIAEVRGAVVEARRIAALRVAPPLRRCPAPRGAHSWVDTPGQLPDRAREEGPSLNQATGPIHPRGARTRRQGAYRSYHSACQ
jgi:hypothetical protein